MNPSDLSAEYASIKNYCRKEAAKSFKHPMAPKPAEPAPAEAEQTVSEMSDEEIDALLREE